MRDSKIITLYENKGDKNYCNNSIGISLLSIDGTVYARVIMIRLQKLAEPIYPESQCGFRNKRSTIDMVFSIRQLQYKCREQQMPLYIPFIDLTKSFDLVSRDSLFKVLPRWVAHPKHVEIFLENKILKWFGHCLKRERNHVSAKSPRLDVSGRRSRGRPQKR